MAQTPFPAGATEARACTNPKVFNKRKRSGVFLPGFNTATSKHDWEFTNEAENAYLIR